MANRRHSSQFIFQQRRNLEQCWLHEFDIDPLILRARWLHSQGLRLEALAMEQELLPIV
ncbi:hypothetical protein [Prochlorococcus marinus]|uniref:hypothetical protein n=1 Tax=Prochlorococcus TaxID=1218 RepID=UPI0007BC5554|nr:hypothetical protein [Prochlorococcus marinus]KZR76581.1 hypothetical protein PMIT1323_01425 [Prochlorococcus marinus str. MIT 1323]